jgi:L-iditol 2-dehydrogenase
MKAAAYNPELKISACLETVELEKPQLKLNNAIIRVRTVGVCGSDLLKLDRSLVKPGAILGHEMVGEIAEISPEMQSKYGLMPGNRIISSHHTPCLECDFCLRKKESLCTQFKTSNFNPGAFCEYLELSEEHLKLTVQKIPDHLSDLEASFTEPVACCIKAIRHCEASLKGAEHNPSLRGARSATKQPLTMKHLIIGLGSIGLIMGQLIKHYFHGDEVYGMDLNEDRLNLAETLGINHHREEQNESKLYDYIYLCAGANSTVDLAIKHARNGATITVFASTPGETYFSNNDIYYKELTIKGSYSPNLEDLQEALKLISDNKIKVDDLISHKTSLENLGTTIKKAKAENGIKVLLEF